MTHKSTGFKKVSKLALAASSAILIFVLGGGPALALDAAGFATAGPRPTYDIPQEFQEGFKQAGEAQRLTNSGLAFPCGSSPGPTLECHFYDALQANIKSTDNAFVLAILLAVMNSLTYITQKTAEAAANWILAGGKGGTAGFFKSTFGNFMEDVVGDTANRFIVEMNDYAKVAFKFNLCTPINPLDLQLSLGIKRLKPLKKDGCNFQNIVRNFEQIQHNLETGDLFKNVKFNLSTGKSDLGIALGFHQELLIAQEKQLNAAIEQRKETRGLKDVVETISGKIKTPSVAVRDTIQENNASKAFNRMSALQTLVWSTHAFTLGASKLPAVFGVQFLNTLAIGGIEALMKYLKGLASGDDDGSALSLLNPEAQSSAEGRQPSVVFTDIVTANLITTEQQDFVHELSSCTTPRGLWGCAMDEGFATGLRLFNEQGASTVARAAGLGNAKGGLVFLHKDWELIPESETKDNQDTGCYQRAYCASNLAKLRFARILPIGWELAANSPYNKKVNGKYITLGEVVRNFNECKIDASDKSPHPWCHLIDPSWVLTAPPFQCRVKGFGDDVFPGEFPVRVQECSDVISCLKRDDKGKCVSGYGYCLSEKTVWRFSANVCEERYVSCRTYNKRDQASGVVAGTAPAVSSAEQVSYLRNTVDYGQCNADNVGCMVYSTQRDVSTTSTGKWQGDIGRDKFATASVLTGPLVYFDATVEKCDVSNDGCTKVLKFTPGEQALNLIKNGSFENMSKSDASKLDAWEYTGATNFLTPKTGVAAAHGAKSLEWRSAGVTTSRLKQEVTLVPLRNHVVSFYARANDESSTSRVARVKLEFLNSKKLPVEGKGKKFYRNLSTCGIESATGSVDSVVTKSSMDVVWFGTYAPSGAWKRYTCEFVANDDAAFASVVVFATGAAIDAVQIEEVDRATSFIDGANTQLSVDHLKLPSEELNCMGDAKKDRVECAAYARMCRQTEAGCQGYTDVGGTSQVEIPATLNALDYCPKECVGYAEYRKLPSAFDLVQYPAVSFLHDPDDDTSAVFIPSRAAQCSVQAAGCEEFTNVEAPSAGGERKAYFKYARACAQPNPKTKTYFTWEGSDVSGYQLRTWALIRNDKDIKDPFESPKILLKAGPTGVVKDPVNCNETSWKAAFDPDCRQFYDETGHVSYRYFSQTILSSPDCVDFRKNNSNVNDCVKTGGDPSKSKNNECVYHLLPAQSTVCAATQASCRGYIGTTGRNTATALHESFAATTTAGFKSSDKLEVSNEALLVGDHSLKLSDKSAKSGSVLSASVDFDAALGSLYTVSFWAKTTEAKHPVASLQVNGKLVGAFTLEVDWKRYELGPFQAEKIPRSTLTWINLPHVTFLDEVDVQRLQDVVYVRQDSWTIPAACERTLSGVVQPQAMLGCREYRDRLRQVVDVRQFSRLCRFESVGCTAYVDTRNSDDPYSQSFELKGLASSKAWDKLYAESVTVIRPADRYVYAIDEQRAHCEASMASCRALGKPKLTPFWTLDPKQPFETIYLKDDVAKYVDGSGELQTLCRPSELFCDRFVGGQTSSYFRDPGDHVCEWRNRIALVATSTSVYSYPKGEYSGWFVKGVAPATPCYPEKLSRGNTFLIQYSGAADTRGWTGLCPKDQSECTEFRDTNDRSDQAHPQGKPYFFINNDRLDKSSCNGKVDLLSGCVLFRDMNNSQLSFNSKATYKKFEAESGNPLSPINCATDKTNPDCVKLASFGRCTNFSATFLDGIKTSKSLLETADFIQAKEGDSCVKDADCSDRGISCNTKPGKKLGGTFDCRQGDKACTEDCGGDASVWPVRWEVKGSCAFDQPNDANLILKVRLDRDCKTWLGCSSGETVYDPGQGKYVDLCTDLSVCDQDLGATGKQFCAHYIDRRPRAAPKASLGGEYYEPVLQAGAFLNLSSYTKRPVGFGESDYSGYALPNHFQIADLVTRRVGYELLSGRPAALRNRFYTDFRLAASTPLYTGAVQLDGPDSRSDKDKSLESPYGAVRFTHTKYPYLNLCQHKQTCQIGYFVGSTEHVPTEEPPRCYFAIDTPYTANTADAVDCSQVNSRNAQELSIQFEQLADPSLSPVLSQAFPPPECKAHPDSQAPFPNVYVKDWDQTSDPPKPRRFAAGYDNAPHCELGEDCACSYRKISYNGVMKYYSPFGQSPPAGICVGGSRDGEACVPDSAISRTTSTQPLKEKEGGNQGSGQVCGTEGACQSIKSISFIRGLHGQCLERDASRPVAGSQAYTSCLVWNPSPVLFGQQDVYHYQPTSGYLPPVSSGEYYCVASALPPRSVEVVPRGTAVEWLTSPGQMEDHKFHYDDVFVSDGDCTLCGGDDAKFIDGASAKGGAMGYWCEQADDDQDTGGQSVDNRAARWIMTGRGQTHSYAEYFIGLKARQWAKWFNKSLAVPAGAELTDAELNALSERNFSYFSFSPIVNPSGNGRIGCGYSHVWTDSPIPDDYDSLKETKPKDRDWQNYFNRTFKKIMSRESQDYLRTEKGDKLLKLPCYFKSSHKEDDDSGCYYKFWELGYRGEGEPKFKMAWEGYVGAKKFAKDSVYFETSQATKPFFAIRAMFEDASTGENAIDANDSAKMPANGNKLSGPFRFVGWWITAAAPGTDSEHAIYMYLTIGTADICTEVAQVVAPDTRESVVFQDRLWRPSGFSIPRLGYTFNTTNEPFGSAKHTRPIGIDPLFQVRGAMPGVNSKLRPPTFISAGAEYAGGGKTPATNWAWMSNLFARVYRIYRFYDQPVNKDSWACVYGSRLGARCPDLSDRGDREAVSQQYCGYVGTCTGPVSSGVGKQSLGLCNSLSGVNAGLSCSGDVSDTLEGYHVCHNAPMRKEGDRLVPLYKPCELQDEVESFDPTSGLSYTWSVNPTGDTYFPKGSGCTKTGDTGCGGRPRSEAVKQGALRCAYGSVELSLGIKLPDTTFICTKRSKPGEVSTECPAMVLPKSVFASWDLPPWKAYAKYKDKIITSECNKEKHCTNGFEHAWCNFNTDCEFSMAQWWGSYNADKPYAAGTLDQSSVGGVTIRSGYGAEIGYSHGVVWWSDKPEVMNQISSGFGDANYLNDLAGKKEKLYLDIGGKNLTGSAYVIGTGGIEAGDMRFPGAYAAGHDGSSKLFIPAHCERAPESDAAAQAYIGGDGLKAHYADRPYAPITYFRGEKGKDFEMHGQFYKTPGDIRFYGNSKQPWKEAICEGGAFEGRRCTQNDDCIPSGYEAAGLQEAAKQFCQPVSKSLGSIQAPNDGSVTISKVTHKWSCQAPTGDPTSDNVDTDNNLCTHNAGYYPRADLCGEDVSRPQCLTAVTQSDPISINPTKSQALPPTDVTSGLYTPKFLASAQKFASISGHPSPSAFEDRDYKYISYYTPYPPTVAAPDTTRQCPASGSCPISQLNAFSIEHQSEGTVAFVGGQAIASMRFYAWAADNQAPLKDIWIDWGDSRVQEYHDSRIKNKKPYCGVTKECQFVPGLTCNSDAACPAGGGKCVNTGFCKTRPNVQCQRDEDCGADSSAFKDLCVVRETFGNSELDCEQAYFQFTHAYACGIEQRTKLKPCGEVKRCARNTTLVCTSDSECGVGDRCLAGLAQPAGCFDTTKAACRFTPRILLKDTWGWCTGDCRVQDLGSGKQGGGFSGPDGKNKILLPNGGCYDGSRAYLNTDTKEPFFAGEKTRDMCAPVGLSTTAKIYKPWIIYQGAIQLGITL